MKKNSKKILITLTIITNIIYILWRIFYTVPKEEGMFALICAIILLFVEIMGMMEMFVHYYGMSNIEYPEKPIISEELYPHVDVFIATYNESVDLVRKTVNGCIHMQYPDKKKVHIYICDDGNREEMRILAEKMGVNYITRTEREGAKAGNLNNAMQHTNSPLIATFDADMIPMHDFLIATVPYFLKNEQAKKDGEKEEYEKVGFVQTPQSFYNPDLFQFNLHSERRIPNEQDYFYRDIQLARNRTNSVIYGGSNTVISREALEEVDGFYTYSITEDFATGILIQSKGYRCYAIPEVHASGLSPTDLKSLIKQRERWARGCIQTGRRLNILFRRGLGFWQKISYISSITYWYASIKRFVYIMAPILFSVFNVIVVKCTLLQVLVFWLPMYILSSLSLKIFSQNIRNIRWTNIYETIMFQSLMPAVILETFAISKNKFSVTNKSKLEENRMYKFLQGIPYFIYMVLSIIGILKMFVAIFKMSSITYSVVLFWLIGNLFNLVMATLFISGRQQLRKSERYIAEIDFKLKQNSYVLSSKTIDISENGFAFLLENPEYISPEEEFEVEFREKSGNEMYIANMKAKIVNVVEVNSKWKYAAYITHIEDSEIDNWMCIVHDRIPTLQMTISNQLGFFDDLQINVKKRIEKTRTLSRRSPRINMNFQMDIKNTGKLRIVNFNYQYVLLNFENKNIYPKEIELEINEGIVLECDLCEGKIDERGILYRVNNIDSIMQNFFLRDEMMDWILQNKTIFVSKPSEKKEKSIDEFEPMEYI